ncbi:HAMP domain-containing sensor histidine kinase [Paraconexibacter sp. AEG42_29]|uniref:HAMP domain-containing sensor histidine kinase n=1 Tax=Paraconexibacter sp. AEG42_29 TaxID=2997339 RepID=UPI00339D7190
MRSWWSSRTLFWRVLLLNALILIGAGTALVVTPATVSSPAEPAQVAELFTGVVVLLAVDVALLRGWLRPLSRLVADMRAVDLLEPGRRVPQDGPGLELIELASAFNEMLDRLERERLRSATASFEASEGERLRIARELHDQVSQDLTALLMMLDRAHRAAGPEAQDELTGARELTREILGGVRTIIFELRPDPLDELGLAGALESLCDRAGRSSGVAVRTALAPPLPAFSPAAEVAIYRITQEALANAARHADASVISVMLRSAPDARTCLLSVRDDGNGRGPTGGDGVGLQGMRERALTIGAHLDVVATAGAGTDVRLTIPVGTDA